MADDYLDISPYQARLYGAVLHGHNRARQKATRTIRRLWLSRRHWQARTHDLEARHELAQALCAAATVAVGSPKALLRADHITYALDPNLYRKTPADWAQALETAQPFMPTKIED